MERDKRTVPGLPEGEGRGGEVPAREMAGDEDPPQGDDSQEQEDASAADSGEHGDAAAESDEDPMHGDASPEQEDASEAGSGGHGGAAAESDEEHPKEAMAEESEGVAVAGDSGRGAASGSAKNEDLELPKNPPATRLRFRAAIAHPTPPTTYRRLPLRSRKQYNPTRFIADQGDMNEAQGSTVTCSDFDASVDKSSSDDDESGNDATKAVASSSAFTSHRPASRRRKQRRPDHFIPEEAEASARAKARRSNAVLDRFLTSVLAVSPAQRPEWVRNVTADDDRGQGQPEEGREEPDGRARMLTIFAILAILGASMALCIASCVLFYIVGRRTEDGRSP